MMKLMKYELMRRKQMFIGAAISMLILEGIVLLGIYNGGGWKIFGGDGWNGWNVLAVALTALLVIGGFVLTFLDAVTRLYSDYKQKHGYMIFMTPQSGYRIIWSKTIFALLEILAAGLVIAGCLTISVSAVDHIYGGVVSRFLTWINVDAGTVIGCCLLGLLQIMAQLSIAILAVTVARVMTQGSSYNWLIALLMYFALAVVVNVVNGTLLVTFDVAGDTMKIVKAADVFGSGLLTKYFAIGAVTYSAWFAGCTLLSGRLINRGVDL